MQEEQRPLDGITVVDLTWVWAGPSATRILADLGAGVIKIESPRRPDSVRALVQFANETRPDFWNYAGYFIEKNLGKRGMTLDLARKEGLQIFVDLVRKADVLVESFSPRVMEQLGLSFEALRIVNPRLIYASMSGYGHDGPMRDRPAYGAALEAESGITATIGYPGGPPVKSGLAYSDPLSGVLAAGAIIDALADRERGMLSEAVHIDISEREVIIPFVSQQIAQFQFDGVPVERIGNANDECVFQDCFACSEHDSWITVSARDPIEWLALVDVVGTQLPDNPRTAQRFISETLEAFFGQITAAEAMQVMQRAGVPAAVVQNGKDLLADPQLAHRGFFTQVRHENIGWVPFPRFLAATFQSTNADPRGVSPRLDANTEEVLSELGLDRATIRRLKDDGVWGHQLEEGSRTNLGLPLDILSRIGAVSRVDALPNSGASDEG